MSKKKHNFFQNTKDTKKAPYANQGAKRLPLGRFTPQ